MEVARRRGGGVVLDVDAEEREVLLQVVDELARHLGGPGRTRPRAYEESELEAEFDRLSRPELEQVRVRDIGQVRDGLRAGRDRIELDDTAVLTWLRALNHLRLAAGELLSIDADGWEERAATGTLERPEYAMLLVLGLLQEGLVAALEEEA